MRRHASVSEQYIIGTIRPAGWPTFTFLVKVGLRGRAECWPIQIFGRFPSCISSLRLPHHFAFLAKGRTEGRDFEQWVPRSSRSLRRAHHIGRV